MAESAKSVGDLDDIARDLRHGAGHELRAEAAADEELTELQRMRRMSLADAVRTAMHRGDRVTATMAGLTISHPVVAVGADYFTMEDGERFVDVRLVDAVLDVATRPSGGRSGRPAAVTFRARIAELEQEGATVEMVIRSGEWRNGRIGVVGIDHVLVAADGRQTYIPFDTVVVVFSRFPPRRR